jgi:DNA-binding response OmpR family regulator
MVTRFPKGETYEKKEIVIVDSDVNLLRILKNAFSAHGITVHTFSEGGDALNEILTYGENRLPALIIIERKLHDMDGMDLFVKLKIRFRKKIPCFMLTLFSSDKDVSEGLSQGVLEYILKPFNISILVQKALRIINQA